MAPLKQGALVGKGVCIVLSVLCTYCLSCRLFQPGPRPRTHKKTANEQLAKHLPINKNNTPNVSNMNALFLALFSLFASLSAVQAGTFPWSGQVELQVSKEGNYTTCSDMAMAAFEKEFSEWVRDELIDLFGEGAFKLTPIQGTERDGRVSFTTDIDCLDCSKVTDKKSIAYILKYFVQHMMDEWIDENNGDNGILEGCLGEDTTIAKVVIVGNKFRTAVAM